MFTRKWDKNGLSQRKNYPTVTVIWQQNSREMPRDEWLKSGHTVVLNCEFPHKRVKMAHYLGCFSNVYFVYFQYPPVL